MCLAHSVVPLLKNKGEFDIKGELGVSAIGRNTIS